LQRKNSDVKPKLQEEMQFERKTVNLNGQALTIRIVADSTLYAKPPAIEFLDHVTF